jgi:uncharacterized membrane protein
VTERRLRLAVAALAALGAGIAAYLTVVKLSGSAPVCGTGGCEVVQHSRYSDVGGVPVAAFGLAMYAVLFASTLSIAESVRTAAAAIGIAGAAVAAFLVYLQLAVIDAICVWCVVSDSITIVLAVLLLARAGIIGAWATGSSSRSRS